jgi:hypothetical protein
VVEVPAQDRSRDAQGQALHLIADNYATHKHPAVQDWLAKHPRFNMQFTATSASWLNMVERFFRDITTERLRRERGKGVPAGCICGSPYRLPSHVGSGTG